MLMNAQQIMVSFHIPDVNECEISNGGCAQTCINKPGSFECRCGSGFALMSNQKSCAGMFACFINISGGANDDCVSPNAIHLHFSSSFLSSN